MIATEVLVDKLNSFTTENEVGDFLQEQNVKGLRASAKKCVIANWIKRESGTSNIVSVGPNVAVFKPVTENRNELVGRHDLSQAVLEFIGSFDHGHYSELDEEPITL